MVTRKQKSRLRHVNLAIYKMAKLHGVDAASVHYSSGHTFDPETGEQTETIVSIELKKFITSGVNHLTTKRQDGKSFQIGDRWGIIQRSELPVGFELKDSHWVVYNGKRYQILERLELDADIGYHVVLRETKGTKLKQVKTMDTLSLVSVTQDIGATFE